MNVSGYCPFSELYTSDKTPLYWVCGGKGVTTFPKYLAWSGCCYPGIVAPGINFVESPSSHTLSRQKREMPTYRGYILADPLTSQATSAGWGMFPFRGVVAALQKINGLALMLEQMKNDTADSITLLNVEMRAIRSVVIQNRMTLDLLTAKAG